MHKLEDFQSKEMNCKDNNASVDSKCAESVQINIGNNYNFRFISSERKILNEKRKRMFGRIEI